MTTKTGVFFLFLLQEQQHEKRQIFGKMDLLPTDEFLDIYYRTGIDIDGRLASIKTSIPVFEQACLKYIQYAQELPGFDALKSEDQVSMLKGKSFLKCQLF